MPPGVRSGTVTTQSPAPKAPAATPGGSPFGAQWPQVVPEINPQQAAYLSSVWSQQHPQAAAAPDPTQRYLDQFNQSLAQSRAQIETNLGQALGELGQRRDAAAGVVAGLPAAINSSYAQASGNLTNAGDKGLEGLHGDTAQMVGAYQQPFQAALQADKGAGLAIQPLLDLGVLANTQSGTAALRQQAMAGQQGLDAESRQFQQGLLLRQMDQEDAAAQRAAEEDDWRAKMDYEAGIASRARKEEYGLQQGAEPAAGITAAGTDLSTTGLKTAEVAQVRAAPSYQRYKTMIESGEGDPQMIQNYLQTKDPKMFALLYAEHPDFFLADTDEKRRAAGAKLRAKGGFSWNDPILIPTKYQDFQPGTYQK